jgi:hypothetical protein
MNAFFSELIINKLSQFVSLFPIDCSIDFHRVNNFIRVIEKVVRFFLIGGRILRRRVKQKGFEHKIINCKQICLVKA